MARPIPTSSTTTKTGEVSPEPFGWRVEQRLGCWPLFRWCRPASGYEAPVCSTFDQVLGEVLADLHDRQVRTEVRRFRAQRGADVVERPPEPCSPSWSPGSRCRRSGSSRPRPAVLKVTPKIASVDLPVSSKVGFKVSPSSRHYFIGDVPHCLGSATRSLNHRPVQLPKNAIGARSANYG